LFISCQNFHLKNKALVAIIEAASSIRTVDLTLQLAFVFPRNALLARRGGRWAFPSLYFSLLPFILFYYFVVSQKPKATFLDDDSKRIV
jgi:hypothetical protein